MKVTLSEIKKNLQESTVEWMKLRIKLMIWNIRKKKTFNQNSKKKKESKKLRIGKGASGSTSNIPVFESQGCWKEKRKQEIENLFEKNNERKLPNLVEEIDMLVQEAQRVPNKVNLKRPTPRHIIIKMPEVKDKERILKAAREKQLSAGEFP